MYNTAYGSAVCAVWLWNVCASYLENFDAGPAFWLQSRLPFLKPFLVKKGFPPYPRNIQYGDVIKGLPIPPQSADAVYCSHVLEHMTLDEFRLAIRNVFSYLRPGGTFRLVLPDLEQLIKLYLNDPSAGAASRFMQDSFLGEQTLCAVYEPCQLRSLAGRDISGCGTTRESREQLAAAGFTDIRRAQLGDSLDPRFSEVESESRWKDCLGVDCQRP